MADRTGFQNILLVRTDRIGDVILTLPMVSAIKQRWPQAAVTMLVREYTAPLTAGFSGLEPSLTIDRDGKPKPFWEMVRELRSRNFDAVIFARPEFRLALLAAVAGIPARIGTGYRFYSVFFNRRVYEHRRISLKHEAEYNLSLLRWMDCVPDTVPEIRLVYSEPEMIAAAALRTKHGIRAEDPLVVLHPGSGGSARDWPAERFGRLGARFVQAGMKVVVTGGPDEEELVGRTCEAGGGLIPLAGATSLRVLGALSSTARLFAANSTGPLHIAAASGVPVIGFYPPIDACSPRRWGPLALKKKIFVPDRTQCPLCKGGPCSGNRCMEQIEVDAVFETANRLLTDPIYE